MTPEPVRTHAQLRQPRLAELVASSLREQILSGELPDGELLPKQEELLEAFGVSLVPLREALRILETEGLVTVQRGKVGGAIVHRPQAGKVAYMLALVLQSSDVRLAEVLEALVALEPACAAACARREDRATEVVPRLTEVVERSRGLIEDPVAFAGLAREFHLEVVEASGNRPMVALVGSLELLWTAHVDRLAHREGRLGVFAGTEARRQSLHEHEQLVAHIEAGEADEAATAMAAHYAHADEPGWGHTFDTDMVVRAEYVAERRR